MFPTSAAGTAVVQLDVLCYCDAACTTLSLQHRTSLSISLTLCWQDRCSYGVTHFEINLRWCKCPYNVWNVCTVCVDETQSKPARYNVCMWHLGCPGTAVV